MIKYTFISSFIAFLAFKCACSTGSNEALLCANDFDATTITLQAQPQQYVAHNVLQTLCGLDDNTEPCVNTVTAILQNPHTLVHYSIFARKCAIYRRLVRDFATSDAHQMIASLMRRTTTFRALHCSLYSLLDRLRNADSDNVVIELVRTAYDNGLLRSTNAYILTDYLLYDDTDHIGFDAFDEIMAMCNQLDVRLRQ